MLFLSFTDTLSVALFNVFNDLPIEKLLSLHF